MQIALFLEVAREPILEAAVAFAKTIPALHDTDDRTLRDHLPHILEAISLDLRRSQSRAQSMDKSHGEAPEVADETSAQTHGLLRARMGISIEQLVAEFRALRSSVLRLWGEAHAPQAGAIEDIARFNEAIDQAVAESVESYAKEREQWRQIFLGIVGHDLRSPLQAISLTVEMMRLRATAPPAQTDVLAHGVKRLTSLLDSLLEYSRANLGAKMVLHTSRVDLAVVCSHEIELLQAAYPQAHIVFQSKGNGIGSFDASRVAEALTNLVSNAVKHGDASEPCVVNVEGTDAAVRIMVENAGEIAPHEFEMLFDPLRERSDPFTSVDRTHLGLGLFITREIVAAHGGEINGSCAERRVRFTVELPKFRSPTSDVSGANTHSKA